MSQGPVFFYRSFSPSHLWLGKNSEVLLNMYIFFFRKRPNFYPAPPLCVEAPSNLDVRLRAYWLKNPSGHRSEIGAPEIGGNLEKRAKKWEETRLPSHFERMGGNARLPSKIAPWAPDLFSPFLSFGEESRAEIHKKIGLRPIFFGSLIGCPCDFRRETPGPPKIYRIFGGQRRKNLGSRKERLKIFLSTHEMGR